MTVCRLDRLLLPIPRVEPDGLTGVSTMRNSELSERTVRPGAAMEIREQERLSGSPSVSRLF
jgi:hypothetical protein